MNADYLGPQRTMQKAGPAALADDALPRTPEPSRWADKGAISSSSERYCA